MVMIVAGKQNIPTPWYLFLTFEHSSLLEIPSKRYVIIVYNLMSHKLENLVYMIIIWTKNSLIAVIVHISNIICHICLWVNWFMILVMRCLVKKIIRWVGEIRNKRIKQFTTHHYVVFCISGYFRFDFDFYECKKFAKNKH